MQQPRQPALKSSSRDPFRLMGMSLRKGDTRQTLLLLDQSGTLVR